MGLNRDDSRQLLVRIIFEDMNPQEWAQDVWYLSPLLGDSAAKLLDAFEALIDCCPEDRLDGLVQAIYQSKLAGDESLSS